MRIVLNLKNITTSYMFRKGISAFLSCVILCTVMLSIYGTIAFKDHLKLVELAKEIIDQRSQMDLDRSFNSYFYWSDMVNSIRKGDISFIYAQLEEMKEDYPVIGLSIRMKGKTIFSEGVDYPAVKTGPQYVVNNEGKLFVGKSFYLIDNDGNIQPDLEYKIWIDLSHHVEQINPFLLRMELIPSSQLYPSTSGKKFLGETRIRTSWFKFLLIILKTEPSVPFFLCLFSILLYLVIVLLIQKYSMQISWSERLRSLTGILEEKDAYTFGHGNRVAEYSVAIAHALGMKEREIRRIDLAAQCHDLGKIFVPGEILNKKNTLTRREFKYIKIHPEDSQRIFTNLIKDKKVGNIIRHHHERWDGKGYPDGLSGKETPLEARIITIADTFDALTSHRPYRSAMPLGKALSVIVENSGTQFDSDLIPISIHILEKVYKEEKASLIGYRPAHRERGILPFLFTNSE